MRYSLIVLLVLLTGCIDRSNEIHRNASSCKQAGYKGVVSWDDYTLATIQQSCSNGERIGECYLTQDGTMCTQHGRYRHKPMYIEFKE